MEKKIIFSLLVIFLIPALTSSSQALQQVAGPIVYDMHLGETKTLSWILVSDENKSVTLKISADGKGSELLSFPENVTVQPKQFAQVNVTVTIPTDHPSNVKLSPSVYATQFGELGNPTQLNIRMQKILTINIDNLQPEQTIPEFPFEMLVLLVSMTSILLFYKTKFVR